jgi:hypothetical protein
VHGVVNSVLAFFHLDFGCTTDPDDSNAAGELRRSLLQVFAAEGDVVCSIS